MMAEEAHQKLLEEDERRRLELEESYNRTGAPIYAITAKQNIIKKGNNMDDIITILAIISCIMVTFHGLLNNHY